ncbi:hypothetical protein BHQ23_19005 [Mycobacterium gordonae]|nr:hypothetical protein BHQ23_19005 [Mycobacterium gordonae]
MSYLIAAPELMAAAATNLASIERALSSAHAAAVSSITQVSAAAGDEVSAAIAALVSEQGQQYRALSAQAAAFHSEFVAALTTGAGSYAGAEAAAVTPLQSLLDQINAPFVSLTGRPLIGNGANGAPGTGAPNRRQP